MTTPITAEALLEIISKCSRSISLGGDGADVPEWQRCGESMDVIDAREFTKELQAYIDGQPKVVFAALVGQTFGEACEWLTARSPYEKGQHPVTRLHLVYEERQPESVELQFGQFGEEVSLVYELHLLMRGNRVAGIGSYEALNAA